MKIKLDITLPLCKSPRMPEVQQSKDYGCDPLGVGMFRLIPSGRVVTNEERLNLFPSSPKPINDCLGLSWDEIERRQGGKLKR